MNVTVVRLGKDAGLCEEGLAILLQIGMRNHALFVHVDIEPTPTMTVWKDEETRFDFLKELPVDFCREVLGLAKSDFKGIGEHFEMPASQVGSQYSPVLLVESGDAKSYWDRTWTDSILQFQRIIQS